MKFALVLCFLSSTIALTAQHNEQLYGNWKYQDVYEKEKIDSVGLKMLQMFFSDMAISFDKNGEYKAAMMQKREEGAWSLDENTNKITMTSSKGKVDEMELMEVSENRLVIKVGKGVFIMARE